MLGGELGKAGGGVLAGEILGGDLLHAGGGEKGDGNGGEQCRYEEDKDEGAARIGGFNHGVHEAHGGTKKA